VSLNIVYSSRQTIDPSDIIYLFTIGEGRLVQSKRSHVRVVVMADMFSIFLL
jgi:hypothetical protein